MLKILPIFIIFFLTGLFLLKVDNLTQRKNKSLSENYDIEANLNSNNQDEVINNSIENYGKQDKNYKTIKFFCFLPNLGRTKLNEP